MRIRERYLIILVLLIFAFALSYRAVPIYYRKSVTNNTSFGGGIYERSRVAILSTAGGAALSGGLYVDTFGTSNASSAQTGVLVPLDATLQDFTLRIETNTMLATTTFALKVNNVTSSISIVVPRAAVGLFTSTSTEAVSRGDRVNLYFIAPNSSSSGFISQWWSFGVY